MTRSDAAALREFLRALTTDKGPQNIPDALQRIARRAVGPSQPNDVVEDVRQSFVLKVIEATKRGSAGSAQGLLEVDDDRRLVAVVVHRMKQVAVAMFPKWPLMKAMRGHVRAVLKDDLPQGANMPVKLVDEAGRISRVLVAAAVGAIVTGGAARSTAAITDQLLDLYFGRENHHDDVGEDAPTAEALVAEHRDSITHAAELERVLGAEVATLVARRCTGTTLETLAAEAGKAVSTLHARLARPHWRMRRLCQRSGVAAGTHTLAMTILASGVRQ